MSAHTPGPWIVQQTKYRIPDVIAMGTKICGIDMSTDVPDHHEAMLANAALIAAAPDMLAALRLARQSAWLNAEAARVVGERATYGEQWSIVKQCDAAIAKAEAR